MNQSDTLLAEARNGAQGLTLALQASNVPSDVKSAAYELVERFLELDRHMKRTRMLPEMWGGRQRQPDECETCKGHHLRQCEGVGPRWRCDDCGACATSCLPTSPPVARGYSVEPDEYDELSDLIL